ncbi:hypothetical protein QBZ16_003523 [Prototheca wickerhamii]|uniref:Lipoyl-binding domain-containing protein n=1 Tax=Prototheca wickerhamii TaxID=3111 RepID=A0AAD9II30_PROWI|nr:hypothetical protein QBZ16_003523 [Prototheca wickerhamii]
MATAVEKSREATNVKLFGKWSYNELEVTDLSLIDYIAVKAKHDRYTPHSAGRFQKKRFRKAQCPIVERLTNSLMMHGRNNGKKQMAIRIVQHAFEIVHLLTDQNPIQAVDVSPLRRVNQAIWLITTGAREASFRNIKTIAECLADELINAAKGSSNSYAIKKKDEIERVAKANRLSWLGRWSGASGQRTAGFHGAAAALATIEVKIPALGESITDGTVAALLKQAGEQVGEDEPLVTVDTDKVSVDVRAPSPGVVVKMLVEEGATVEVGHVVATIDTEGAGNRGGRKASAGPKEEATAPAGGSAAPETPMHADDAAGGRPWNPSIRFPPRRTDKGDRISALAAQEADRILRELGWLKGTAADEYPPTVLASAAPPPKQGPWLQAHRDVEVQEDDGSIVPRTAMSEREMELIMLGGAEP